VVGTGATAAREYSSMRLDHALMVGLSHLEQFAGPVCHCAHTVLAVRWNKVGKDNLLLADANTDGAIGEITEKGIRAGGMSYRRQDGVEVFAVRHAH
jgi:hypothetical protein